MILSYTVPLESYTPNIACTRVHMRVHMRVSGNEALTVREFEAEDLTRNSMPCGEDVFFHKFPHDLHRRLALLPQSYYPLSHISTQTARHTFRLQEDDTGNVA